MNLMNIGFCEASIVSSLSAYTSPLEPFRLSQSPSFSTLSPNLTVFFARSMCMASHPTMQHLPQPRATSAACEVIPPRVVRIPSAARMPSMSSGDVSSRMRMAFMPSAAAAMASAELNTIWPTAPPGDAGRPIARTVAFFSEVGFRIGWSISSSCAGETLITAVFSSIIFSSTMSRAICRAAKPVRLPMRH